MCSCPGLWGLVLNQGRVEAPTGCQDKGVALTWDTGKRWRQQSFTQRPLAVPLLHIHRPVGVREQGFHVVPVAREAGDADTDIQEKRAIG